VLSAGDLVDFMACEHLAVLEGRVALGELRRPAPSEEERLIASKGQAHERAYLERLRAEGRAVVEIRGAPDLAGRRRAAEQTIAALEAGAEIVHGAVFLDLEAGWSGVADFLMLVPGVSRFGDWHYEVADTKLARSAKVSTLIQLCVYGELLEKIQGVAPRRMHAILGDGTTQSFETSDYEAYYRRLKERFVTRDLAADPYPEPVEHCGRCRWLPTCDARRRADDYLSLVANIRRSQIAKLGTSGIMTVAELAAAGDDEKPRKLERATFEKIRAQAALQVEARAGGAPIYELLAPVEGHGFARLPPPDPGDLYFDMEGDPFYDDAQTALEYLFGVTSLEGGAPRFVPFWGHDRRAEGAAFEAFIDFVMERRARFPALHVYHYASYEPTALKRLAQSHATREDEVDVLLRERVLVDLLDVVRQSLRASFESYSLKKIEQFYLPARQEAVKDALGSVVAYERFLASRDQAVLDEIAAYNRADCDSTLGLHRWLLERRVEAETLFATPIPWRALGIEDAKPPKADPERDGLIAELVAGIDPENATGAERARLLVAHLVAYHKREAKPEWWAYFARVERPIEELVDEASAIGALVALDVPPRLDKQSYVYVFRFDPQEHKLRAQSDVHDPATRKSAGTLLVLDDDACTLELKRGPSFAAVALPAALVASGPIPDSAQRSAMIRFGRAYATDGARTGYRVLGDVVRLDPPRVRGVGAGEQIDDGHPTAVRLTQLALALDESYLFVQGPPGSGKTWLGAETIVNLIAAGKRIGITSKSHKAIHNLLRRVEAVAAERGFPLRGIKKCSSSGEDESVYVSQTGAIVSLDDTDLCASDPAMQVVAGTAWLFADKRMDRTLDYLVIDEAGQVSLADAIACGTAARNLILLGDPKQLAHVSKANHPAGADASVLQHLLGDRPTVPKELGLFLPLTYRMHPSLCAFVSQLSYEGRLHSQPACSNQNVALEPESPFADLSGAGLRYLPVAHDGNIQQSPEEAETIADVVAALLAAIVTDCDGVQRPLEQRDILIVTPYNAQVRRLRSTLRARGFPDVRAGTVDKFQGQEAPVVFFSMASSSGDELSRGVEFLFERNRLNVAVSRARALAILVCSPALLETRAGDADQLPLINALCRFVEAATP
jgi:uncharacterized protein